MQNRFIILKFGGTSVSSLACWTNIANIVSDRSGKGFKPVIVCSAVSGVSDMLEEAVNAVFSGSSASNILQIQQRHEALAQELGVDGAFIQGYMVKLTALLNEIKHTKGIIGNLKADVMACGEFLSTQLGAAYLQKAGIDVEWRDARLDLVSRRSATGNVNLDTLAASCNYDRDDALIEKFTASPKAAIISQGFIARDAEGDTVLLGRGGSDVSAAYFAGKLCAEACEIWTDLPGLYTGDPRIITSAQLIKVLDYDEAQEIASFGVNVLHPKCLAPLKKQGIPLKVFCLGRPDADGTSISAVGAGEDVRVKAVLAKKGRSLIAMESVDMWRQVGFLADVFTCFRNHGISIDLASSSEANVTVTLDKAANALTEDSMAALMGDLSSFCQTNVIDKCALVSLVGRNIREMLPKLSSALDIFKKQKIYLLSQAANDLNITFVVDEDQAEPLARQLHKHIFGE